MGSAPVPGNLLLSFAGGSNVNYVNYGAYVEFLNAYYSTDTLASYKYAAFSESTTQTPTTSDGTTATLATVFELAGAATYNPILVSLGSNNGGSSGQYYATSFTTTVTSAVFCCFDFQDYNGITGCSSTGQTGFTLIGPFKSGASNAVSAVTRYILYNLAMPGTSGAYPAITITGTPNAANVTRLSVAVSLPRPSTGNMHKSLLQATLGHNRKSRITTF
jgi:hypothetical protein